MLFTRSAIRALTAAALISLAGVVAGAVPATALPAGGSDPGTDPPERPDLRVSALTVSAPTATAWTVAWTVANSGLAGAGSSTLAIGGTQASIPSLAPGASRSGTLQLARTDCFVSVSTIADSGRVVTESNETNNTRTTVYAVPGCPPRYKIRATQFHVVEETGIDQSGSDEPYWIFSSVSNTGTASTRRTQVFGDIDEGDTQQFPITDDCVWGCTNVGQPAPFGIGLSVQLWEHDLGDVDEIWHDTAQFFQDAGGLLSNVPVLDWVGDASTKIGEGLDFILTWAEDDLLGTNTYGFSAQALANALPSRGTAFTDTRTYRGNGGEYTLMMSISRVV